MIKRSRGFTLLELIVVIVMLSLLSASVVPFGVASLDAYHNTTRSLQAMDKLDHATERIAMELRAARRLVMRTATSITYTNATGQTVHLAMNGNLVQMTVGTLPAATLIDQVVAHTGLQFDYRDFENQPVASDAPASAIRHVVVSLTMSVNGRLVEQNVRTAFRSMLS